MSFAIDSRKCNWQCDRYPLSQRHTLATFFSLWCFTSI